MLYFASTLLFYRVFVIIKKLRFVIWISKNDPK